MSLHNANTTVPTPADRLTHAYDDGEVTLVLAALQVRCDRDLTAAGYRGDRRVDLGARAQRFVVRYNPEKHPEPLTLFHSAQLLPITLRQLFDGVRARRGVPFENGNAVIAAALFDRFASVTGLPVTPLMVHRLFVAALVVSAKVHNDVYALNSTVARAVSMTLQELNDLEMELLVALDFSCLVDATAVGALLTTLGLSELDKSVCRPAPEDAVTVSDPNDDEYIATVTTMSG